MARRQLSTEGEPIMIVARFAVLLCVYVTNLALDLRLFGAPPSIRNGRRK
jgi:hypothetical protein